MEEEQKQTDEIPDHIIDSLARSFLPEIQQFFETEDGRRQFEEWKAEREKLKYENIEKET